MAYLKNKSTGAVVGPLDPNSPQFHDYQDERSNGQTLWEQVSEDQVLFRLEFTLPAKAIAADETTDTQPAPVTGSVVQVDYEPVSAITGADTNSRTLTAVDGATTLATKALTSGVNMSANRQNPLTVQTGAHVTAGDAIGGKSTHVGTGIADPGGVMSVTIQADSLEV